MRSQEELLAGMANASTEIEPVMTLDDAYYVYDMLMEFYDEFHNVENYALLKKKEHNLKFGTRYGLDGNPIYSSKIFSDVSVSPEDMKFRIDVVNANNLDQYNTLLNLVGSHTYVAVPGRQISAIIWEENTNTIVGFTRVNSPTLNMKPRSTAFDYNLSKSFDEINNNMMVGTVIVPTQPFGYNYLGGKLLALLCVSNEMRELMNTRYDIDIKYFETTALYGSIKGTSQYDGLKPYIRNGGLTESKMIPIPTNKIVKNLYKRFEKFRQNGALFGILTGSIKIKVLGKIYGLTLAKLKEEAPEKHLKLKEMMAKKTKEVTTQKLYYYSTYGVGNLKDHVIDKQDPKFNIPASRFDMDSVVDWWKKKAVKRYAKLKADDNIQTKVELWTDESIDNVDIQMIR